MSYPPGPVPPPQGCYRVQSSSGYYTYDSAITHCLTHVAAADPQEEEMRSETNPALAGAAPAPHTEDRVVGACGYMAALAMVSTHLQRWSALSSRGVNFSRNSKAQFTSSVKS